MEEGFSALELLLTIALLGILALSSAPIRRSPIVFYLHREAFALASEIEGCATAVPLRGSPIRLAIERRGYSKEYSSGRANFHAFHPEVSTSTQGIQVITFYPSGVNSPQTVRLFAENHSCTVRVSLRGRVTTECL